LEKETGVFPEEKNSGRISSGIFNGRIYLSQSSVFLCAAFCLLMGVLAFVVLFMEFPQLLPLFLLLALLVFSLA